MGRVNLGTARIVIVLALAVGGIAVLANGFESAAMDALLRHAWPGNVRELEHAVERAVLMASSSRITPTDLSLRRMQDAATSLESMPLEDVEAFLIKKAVSRYGSVTDAAKALGLSRSALYRRLERYGIQT